MKRMETVCRWLRVITFFEGQGGPVLGSDHAAFTVEASATLKLQHRMIGWVYELRRRDLDISYIHGSYGV